MKRIFQILSAALIAALAWGVSCAGCAQTIRMDDVHLSFEYPDSWLVVSPQLARVYAPLLEENGIDAKALSADMELQGVKTRAYNPAFNQRMSVIVSSDALSQEIFDITRVTEEQRKTLRSRAENNRLWETTGNRVQDVEWQKEGGAYWLYLHYTRTYGDKTVGRGLRYLTVRNGMYVAIDWQVDGGRFSNRDLRAFRAQTQDLTVTKQLDMPAMTVRLEAQLPTETSVGEFTLKGKSTPGATLLLETPDETGAMFTLAAAQAGANGAFELQVALEEEGTFDLTLTASLEGMNDSALAGTLAYSAKTMPVTIDGIEEGGVHTVTSRKVTIGGKTLAGVQMQLVSPFGLTKKRTQNDGAFSFTLSTENEGEYDYVLILDKKGFEQRRIQFTLRRVMTDEQTREQIKDGAEKISYKNLQKARGEDYGKVMVIYGPVTELSDGGGQYYMRMQYNKDAQGTWYNEIVVVAGEDMGVKVGDMATVAASVAGVYEEQDANGDPVMVPRFELMFVDKVE